MTRTIICIGFGALKGKCERIAGTRWTPYWCEQCDELRRATITAQLNELATPRHQQP